MTFQLGEPVTLLQAQPDEPYILEFQRYATVVASLPAGYMIELADVYPPNHFGPFPESRLAHGWRTGQGLPR